jgi:hypothetical protein
MQAKQGSPEDPGGERKEKGFGKEEVKAKNLVVDAQKKSRRSTTVAFNEVRSRH